jgi:SAM-dependent methyltransferase
VSSSSDPISPFDAADVYDVVFHDLDYAVDFYVELARQASGPILEIACGTGRILIPCMQAGAEVDGLDYYQSMLDMCRKKAAALHLAPNLYQADMSDFRLARTYALITITFNAFIHNLTQENQIRCLKCCRDHLMPGGMLVFDTFFPALSIVGAPEHTRVLEGESTDSRTGLRFRMYDTRTFDRVRQTQHSVSEIEYLDAHGNAYDIHRSEFTTRYVYQEEMKLLLRVAGFDRWEIFGDFARTPLTKEDQAMIVFAYKDSN